MSKRSISTRYKSRLFLSCHSLILVSKIGLYAPNPRVQRRINSIFYLFCIVCVLFSESESGKIRGISVAAGVNLKFGYMRLSFLILDFPSFII